MCWWRAVIHSSRPFSVGLKKEAKVAWSLSLVCSNSNDSIANRVHLWSNFKASSGAWRKHRHYQDAQHPLCVKLRAVTVPPCISLMDWFYSPFMRTRKPVWIQSRNSQIVLPLNLQILRIPSLCPLEHLALLEAGGCRTACAWCEEGRVL